MAQLGLVLALEQELGPEQELELLELVLALEQELGQVPELVPVRLELLELEPELGLGQRCSVKQVPE